MNQLELHKKIDKFFDAGVNSASVNEVEELLINIDTKRYFFSKANELWLGWLWENGLMDDIKKKPEDNAKNVFFMPELEYLAVMADKNPEKIAQIIDSIKISEENLNIEVINRFLWIISTLPSDQIKTLTAKIRDERWVYLVREHRKTGYEFDKIVKRLSDKKESMAIIELAQAILIVKSKEEILENKESFRIDDPFYVSDLDASGIFEALINVDETNLVTALEFTTKVISEIIKLSKSDDTKVFTYMESFPLFDVDFFELEISDRRSSSYREDIKNLAATIKILIEKTIGNKNNDAKYVKKIFNCINVLPSCRSMWRLRLFAISQRPEIFKEESKKAFFKLFDTDNYYEIEGGTEYKKALSISFFYLSDKNQRLYINNVLQYFSKKAELDPDKVWIKRTGWEILSSICKYINEKESEKCEELFGSKCDESYKPEPVISESMGGIVVDQSPFDLNNYSVEDIVVNLKLEWSPEKINEKFKDGNFLRPKNAEGLGGALKEDIKNRIDEYFKNINNFFDRDNIDPSYLYFILRGVEDMLRENNKLSLSQIGDIIELFKIIKNEGEKEPFRRSDNKSWLADWIEVHRAITDILLNVLENVENKKTVQDTHRGDIKNIISYLLLVKDSPNKDDEKTESNEPYHVAINSVRGRAYELFVVFTQNEGNTLSDDVKDLFKEVLKDESLAIRFVVGRYLASFYFRDKDFIVGLFDKIFPKNNISKKDIYLAAWEGYLSNTLYDQLFVALHDYYSYAILLDSDYYTKRKYSKGLDESLATHLALAFAHLNLDIKDDLFLQFWEKKNIARFSEFIAFIGRSCINRDQASDEWLKENKVSKGKLIKFWDWALNKIVEPEVFSHFGFWINPGKEILSDEDVIERIAQTLVKSKGAIDWDYGLTKRLTIFAEKNGKRTLDIISNYLLNNNKINPERQYFYMHDSEIKDALTIIYKNGDAELKTSVYNLINILIEKGSSTFWALKEILN